MRVMLVYPNERMDTLIPIGPSLLSAYLKKAGHEVNLYDTTFIDTGKQQGDMVRASLGQVIPVDIAKYGATRTVMTDQQLQQDFRRAVQEYKPGLIGYSVLEMTVNQGFLLAEAVQDLKIPTIFGGLYATFEPREVLKHPAVDMICEGEGEEMFPELATAVEQGRDPTGILNLTIKHPQFASNGILYRSGERTAMDDLPTILDIEGQKAGIRRPPTPFEDLLMPDWTIYEDRRFWKRMFQNAVRTVAFESSRGCPYACTFCCADAQKRHHKASLERLCEKQGIDQHQYLKEHPFRRQKSMPRFVDEIRKARDDHGITFVYCADESFLSTSRERLDQFLEAYEDVKLPFFFETRAETVKSGQPSALQEVGCAGVAIGIESGSPEFRRTTLNRKMDNSTIIRAFRTFADEGPEIRLSANNIIGFPGETREDIMATIELNRQLPADSIMVNVFRPYSGTVLRKVCYERGLIKMGETVEDHRIGFQGGGRYYNGVLTDEELDGLRRTFPLYVRFPKSRWPEIEKAEFDEETYKALVQEARESHDLLHREK